MPKRFSLMLMLAACVWFAVRDFAPLMPGGLDGFDGPAVVYGLATDDAIDMNPGEPVARNGQAEAYRQLGDSDRANAEMQATDLLELSDAFPGLIRISDLIHNLGDLFATPKGAWLLCGAVWVALTLVNIAAGRAQTREAAASVTRLLWVALVLGIIESLPLAVWAMSAAWSRLLPVNGWFAAGATFLNLLTTLPMLQPPVRMPAKGAKLPRVEDRDFLQRVAELARQMEVANPVVRLWPSITGSQQALAFAGTIQAPQLVVTDGILTRLSPLERDAVVAHELGHVANGSLWLLTAVIPLSGAIATAVSAWLPASIAVAFGVALAVGLRRLVCRPLEIDADRRAARAIGVRETIAALTKIHAVHTVGKSGPLPLLVYGTATHPSPELRLWSLRQAASVSGMRENAPCPVAVRRHRIMAVVAFGAWLAVLGGMVVAAAWDASPLVVSVPLWIVAATPTALMWLAQRRQIAIANRRLGRSRWRTAFLMAALLACPVLACFPDEAALLLSPLAWSSGPEHFLFIPLLLAGGWLVGAMWWKRVEQIRKLRGEVAVAFQVHDFHRVLDIGRSAAAVVARDPFLRYHVGFAYAICGEREMAIVELQQLWNEHPAFPVTAFTLTSLLLDADQAERARAVAQSLAGRLPDDAATHVLVARALRRLGRLAEARQACEQALAIEPENGHAHAVASAIALDRGEFDVARQTIATALELAPREPYVMVIRAEIAIKTELFENPRQAVEEAIAVIRANPLAFYRADLSRLEHALVKVESGLARLDTPVLVG